ncbi:MAG TPA: type I-B CRISPR-associated protein Cas7/Cst2/DevR [Methanospirillum sp.]|uniref:type I-B CRISPR-associated protein Cas7/Cst2/DevR n=1 Tax=Methanospirillum sp. TaxID=45200 RepID=UPI002C2DBEC1|nr:type I-B CRISPR-associated protein Cas7/Cst2/DevR [Methanospirillum sp.]HOJ96562.1 type I-B CRISPR-associated protein Cas7/Cst2/DevR [Methanospirillum sp.]HPP78395.1 type I-B CRISPR-associated protein Cas7/Cst2/DevR [Methanospirillum sp.]
MKTIIGTYLINAPFSALNNKGIDSRSGNENEVATKTIQSPEGKRPYVSAQALRFWWRNVLEQKYSWICSPVDKIGDNQAITMADPLKYPDDDLFGYMSARKVETEVKGKKKSQNVTVTRVSPLKCSPLIGLPISPNSDFGVMNRKFEGNPVLFNHQFYSNILKGIFALDIDAAGTFSAIDKPGSKNLSEDLIAECDKRKMRIGSENRFRLSENIRKQRIIDTISALKYLSGGAMQTLHHTDVTPKAIILCAINSGNNIFMDVFPHNNYEEGLINLDALTEVLTDYKEDLLTGIYIGWQSGFGSDKDKELQHYTAPDGVTVTLSSPAQAIELFVNEFSEKSKSLLSS